MALNFVTLDVFTTTPFKGNPLGVVHLPPNKPITQEQKQAIAREFNLSESVFVHDVDPANDPDPTTRRIDIFMTTAELPFAGHPTIGSAAYLQAQGITRLITKAGPIPIRTGADSIVYAAIPHNVHLNSRRLGDWDEAALRAGSLHETPAIRAAELQAPIFSIVNGMTFSLIRLEGLEQLAQVAPGKFALEPKDIMDEEWSQTFIGRYYHVITGTSVDEETLVRTVRLRTRMVEDVIEDPATGSAACALTSYLALHEYEEKEIRFEVTQGVEMGRQSDIEVVIKVAVGDDKQRRVDGVQLGGRAVQIMKGTVVVPHI
ncbi:hypothetical protein ACHAQA_001813 [Verticillium albo-atrum]